ncbi:hypothetical protein ABOM_003211 [Aspergillus bombycis]|uniref:F-box domain protein n=1 Tax=Aspergillus bombycis TaxID=109264 RepID=A0A1F8AB16_9EURO|nr:hypothetical protein ABOM_003211 [Aspergillus bombycis]OGM48892.1 hypothetical protein ABOM_003211 [Aspergillus bombycis]
MVYLNHTQLRGVAKTTSVSHDQLSGTTLGCSGDGSAGSSVTSLRSSSVATSSAGSSEILVGLGISTTTLGLKVEDHQLPITPRPYHGHCVGGNGTLLRRNELDKPLPPLPLGESAPSYGTIEQRYLEHGLPKHYPLPPRPLGREHWSLPNKPEARDLAALDRAFARKGLLSNPLRHLRAHRHLHDAPTAALSAPLVHGLDEEPRKTGPLQRWQPLETRNKPGVSPVEPAAPITQTQHNEPIPNPALVSAWAEDIPAIPATTAAPQAILDRSPAHPPWRNEPPIHTDLGAVTRVQRILSILLENRAFLCMPNMLDEDRERYANDFIAEAQLLLLGRSQPTLRTSGSGSHAQGPSSTACAGSTGPITPMPQPRHSIYELDVRSRASSYQCAWNVPVPVMLRILQQVDCLEDLFSVARVNRVAYKTFKAHELPLIQRTLWKVSPPAWELRQVSEVAIPYTKNGPDGSPLAASLYLRHYARDLETLVRIKILIWCSCRAVVREEMMEALCNTGSERGAAVEDAIWRVWTFCHLFGSRKGRECDLTGQVRWLRGQTCSSVLPQVCCTSPDPSDFNTVLFTPPDGFAHGNQGPLSEEQLCDMLEVWTAMATLLDFLRVQTPHARRYGVFNNTGITPGNKQQEEFMLNAWLDFILTLGPAAVLELAQSGRRFGPGTAFAHANSNGWTHWNPPPFNSGSPDSGFLAAAVKAVSKPV